MGKKGFLFPDKVGMFESNTNEVIQSPGYFHSVDARIELVQNGYELHYGGKSFIANTLDEALKMIKSWMEENEARMSKKTETKDENTDHEG